MDPLLFRPWPANSYAQIPVYTSDGNVHKIRLPRSIHHPLPNSNRFLGFQPAAVAQTAVGAHVAELSPKSDDLKVSLRDGSALPVSMNGESIRRESNSEGISFLLFMQFTRAQTLMQPEILHFCRVTLDNRH